MPNLRTGLGLRRCANNVVSPEGAAAQKLLSDAYGKYKKISVGSIVILGQKDFEKKWDEIYSPGKSWKNWVVPNHGNLEGFAYDNVNYINKDNMSIDTVPHEMLHNNQDPKWRPFVADPGGNESKIGEGVTEYLTIKAVTAAGQTPSHSYPDEEGVIQVLVGTVGEETVIKAYFNGETAALQKAVNDKCKGTWTDFKDAMDKGQWARAKLLAKSK
jgi:hypothetical protein